MNPSAQSTGFCSILIHWEQSSYFITASPQVIILYHFTNLAKKSPICAAFLSSKASEPPKSRATSAASIPLHSPQSHNPGTRDPPEQEVTMLPCCPPMAMPPPVSRSGALPKISLFSYGDCLLLALRLDCFPCSNVAAFTNTIGAFI